MTARTCSLRPLGFTRASPASYSTSARATRLATAWQKSVGACPRLAGTDLFEQQQALPVALMKMGVASSAVMRWRGR